MCSIVTRTRARRPAFWLAFLGIVSRWPSLQRAPPAPGSSPAASPLDRAAPGDYEVVATDFGWTTPANATSPRRIVSGEFFAAVVSHPRYNATAWADLAARPDPTRKIVAFLDVETCLEFNYPVYGKRQWWENFEPDHPAGEGAARFDSLKHACQYLKRAAASPALTAHPASRLVVLDCSGSPRFFLKRTCSHPQFDVVFDNAQVVVAYTSAVRSSFRGQPPPKAAEVGLPPPALKPAHLPAFERHLVRSCAPRRYLFSFQGQNGYGREGLLQFDDRRDFYVRLRHQKAYAKDIRRTAAGAAAPADAFNYTAVLEDSAFAGAPRGDNLFSYRFAEILSAGTVPVVFADGWLPPFRDAVVNWTECAVFVPEREYDRLEAILRAIPPRVRCAMQRCALAAWDDYVADREGWVRGLIASVL